MDFSTDTWAGIFFVLALLFLIALIVLVAIWQGLSFARAKVTARASLMKEQEYRQLAQQATRAQEEALRQLQRLEVIESRLSAIESLLREVDEPALPR